MLSLPKDILGHLLSWVSTRDALSVLLSCKTLCEAVLKTRLAPWDNRCRGLVHALEHNHLSYFALYAAMAGKRFDPNAAVAPLKHQFVPLFAAVCGKGNVDAVRILLRYGADPTVASSAALRCAAAEGHIAVVQLLLTETACDPGAFASEALYLAAFGGHVETLRVLAADPRASRADAVVHARARGAGGVAEARARDLLEQRDMCTTH